MGIEIQEAPIIQGADRAGPASQGLRLDGISKTWRNGKASLTVLDHVEVGLPAGTLNWIGGRNGAGKTTLLRIIAGMMSSDSGRVELHGLNPVQDRRRYQSRIGFLSAGDRGLYPRLSVSQHLEFWTRLAFVPKPARPRRIERALAMFELAALADRRADRLSLGQRQRLRLALAFLHEPSLALLDEPHNSLDAEGLAVMRLAIQDVIHRGGIVLWCSPSSVDLGLDGDSAFWLEDGQLTSQ